jgi:glycerophosphoryl diester phosphodiesterase
MRFIICTFLFLLLLLSCRKDQPLFKFQNQNGDTVTAIGHGGMGASYRFPGNTLESLTAAVKAGVHGVEMDIRMSSDSVLVLYHHNSLEDGTECSGDVSDMPWSELQNCNYNEKTNRPKLISAADFFSSAEGQKISIFVWDIKQEDTARAYSEQFGAVIVRTLNELGIKKKCILESSNVHLLRYLSKQDSSLRLFVYADAAAAGIEMLSHVPVKGVTIDLEKITAAEVELLHSKGLQVSVFNASTPRLNSDALLLSPDYIQTDKVEHLMGILNKY